MLDLAVTQKLNARVSVFAGDGNGNFAPVQSILSISPLGNAVSGNFSDDGLRDLGWVHAATPGSVFLALGQSSGAFGTPESFSLAPNGTLSWFVAAGTFNEDCTPDLVIANRGSNNVSLLLNSFSNAPPIADAGENVNAILGETVTLDGSGSLDPDGDAFGYRWTLLTRPTGSTAALAGDTTSAPSLIPDLPGSYEIQLVVDGGACTGSSDTVSLTVLPVGTPPVFTSTDTATLTVGESGSFTITTTGTQPLTLIESGVLPTGMTFTDNGDGTATLSGTPAVGTGGTYEITFTANNGVVPDAVQSFTLTVNTKLTVLGPANVWLGLKNSDDVGTNFDVLAEVLRNGIVVGEGQLDGVSGGSGGFNNAILRIISLVLPSATNLGSGDTLGLRLSVRIAVGVSGHRSGTARLWFNDAAANSRFNATIGGVTSNYYLVRATASTLDLASSPGLGPKKTVDVFVDRAVGGNPFKPLGTWTLVLH